jgi:hypothetical protein
MAVAPARLRMPLIHLGLAAIAVDSFLLELPRWPLLGLLAVAFAIYLRVGTVPPPGGGGHAGLGPLGGLEQPGRPGAKQDFQGSASRSWPRPTPPWCGRTTASATTGAAPPRRPCCTWCSRGRSASCSDPGGSSATTWCSTWAAGSTPPSRQPLSMVRARRRSRTAPRRTGKADFSDEMGSGRTPRNGAGSIATDTLVRPRPARIWVSSPPKEWPSRAPRTAPPTGPSCSAAATGRGRTRPGAGPAGGPPAPGELVLGARRWPAFSRVWCAGRSRRGTAGGSRGRRR